MDEPWRSRDALAEGFRVIATSENAPYAAVADEARRFYAVQFHPEVVHTPDGAKLIANFVHKIAGLASDWTMATYRRDDRENPGAGGQGARDLRAFGGCRPARLPPFSSTRRSAISSRASSSITGSCGSARPSRWWDCFAITTTSRSCMWIASAQFLGALAGVSDPEVKRKTIGKHFIDVFEAEAKKIGGAEFRRRARSIPT